MKIREGKVVFQAQKAGKRMIKKIVERIIITILFIAVLTTGIENGILTCYANGEVNKVESEISDQQVNEKEHNTRKIGNNQEEEEIETIINEEDGSNEDSLSLDFSNSQEVTGAENVIDSGLCGANVGWKLIENEMEKIVLIINGHGDIFNFGGEIAVPWKDYCSSVEIIIIKDEINSIGNESFSDFTNLKSVNIESELTRIGRSAFHGCLNLKNINIPNSVLEIEDSAFYGCSQIEEINLPENITQINPATFFYCTKLKSIEIPTKVETIGKFAFRHCESLKNVSFLSNINNIDELAFSGCKSLEEINIPESINCIKERTFEHCTSLKQVYIPNTVTEIREQAFLFCSDLVEVNIPDSVIYIREQAFAACENLKQVYLSEALIGVENYAFEGCKNLVEINLGKNINNIADTAFWNCTLIAEINIANDNNSYCSIDGILFNKQQTEIILYPPSKKDRVYSTPETVVKLGMGAFRGNSYLESMFLSNSITEIAPHCFSSCNSLVDIQLPDKLEILEDWVFSSCDSLQEITLPDSIVEIQGYAFMLCNNLVSINIPKKIKLIGESAFSSCYSLTEINITGDNCTIQEEAFRSCRALAKVVLEEGVASIYARAFRGCDNLREVTISKSVNSIAEGPVGDAFQYLNDFVIYGYSGSYAEAYAQNRNIPFVIINEYKYNYKETSFLTETEWKDWLQTTDIMISYLSKKQNFPHVTYILNNDDSIGGRFEYLFVNFVEIGKGWRELLSEDTSKEEAEKIFIALLEETDNEIRELAYAKTAKNYCSMLSDTLYWYVESDAYDTYFKNRLYKYLTSNEFELCVKEIGPNSALDTILQLTEDSKMRERMKDTISNFKTSNVLKSGLKGLGIGLDIIDLSKISLDSYMKYLQIKEANDVYYDMLQYVADTAEVEVVRSAATSVYNTGHRQVNEELVMIAKNIISSEGRDLLINTALDKVWFLRAAKEGLNMGKNIANEVFHTWDTFKLKNSMRVNAYIGDSISEWVIRKYNIAKLNFNYKNAESVMYGMELLTKARRYGEESLRKCATYIGDGRGEKLSIEVISTLDSYLDHIKLIKEYNLALLRVACPVDVEIYDVNGNLALSVSDGIETSGHINGIYYYTYYSPIEDGYIKVILTPKGANYSCNIKGNDLGKLSFSISEINRNGETTRRGIDDVSIDSGKELIIPSLESSNQEYNVIQNNNVIEKKQLEEQDISSTISVSGIETVFDEPILLM